MQELPAEGHYISSLFGEAVIVKKIKFWLIVKRIKAASLVICRHVSVFSTEAVVIVESRWTNLE
ncbi:MAG: hypothetical protein ACKERG_00815 [Candidatus Hodgkinia cicadicola]